MKTLLLTSTAAAALFVSSTVAAQQSEQDVSTAISEQVADISTELFSATKQYAVESLESWGEEIFSISTDETEDDNSSSLDNTQDQPTQ